MLFIIYDQINTWYHQGTSLAYRDLRDQLIYGRLIFFINQCLNISQKANTSTSLTVSWLIWIRNRCLYFKIWWICARLYISSVGKGFFLNCITLKNIWICAKIMIWTYYIGSVQRWVLLWYIIITFIIQKYNEKELY